MKTILEHKVDYNKAVLMHKSRTTQNRAIRNLEGEYSFILRVCLSAEDEEELRRMLPASGSKDAQGFEYFTIGYGAGHMWVHQKQEGVTLGHRLIFVQFPQE